MTFKLASLAISTLLGYEPSGRVLEKGKHFLICLKKLSQPLDLQLSHSADSIAVDSEHRFGIAKANSPLASDPTLPSFCTENSFSLASPPLLIQRTSTRLFPRAI
ncbi:hypothetical protein Strain138_002171 [Pseudogemmatithrix spongiicola]|uniref:Uncharacterized protein n=1 Tax=Pseudogemmatithrix spongiicola TaxID=3062599 RepID=A0AA49K207_9BACT|nr:hypothetical protein Strain138_002171 [Gemmatimonadaceae bacterium 'strain 138']WKW15768.1 hypothetical protein Strain318_002170 [Gemmatimonadaceae bacterium 'strain 318']